MRAGPDGSPHKLRYQDKVPYRMTPPGRVGRWVAMLIPILLTGCQGILDPKGYIGQANKTILIDSLAIMLAIVIPTIAATLGFAYWFRASNTKAKYLPDFAYSGRVELITWSIPLLTIILLGGVAWIGSHELDPAEPLPSKTPPLQVQGVSLDWKWLFIYPDQHIASVNQLVVPIGVPIHFALTSASVMNTFFIPQLGSMIYTMNGMATQLNLDAEQAGHVSGNFRSLQRRRVLGHALRCAGGAARPVHRVGHRHARHRAVAGFHQLRRSGQAKHQRWSVYLPRRGGRHFSEDRHAATAARARPAHRQT